MIDLNTMLSALKSDPQAREAIRREILTEGLLALSGASRGSVSRAGRRLRPRPSVGLASWLSC